MDEASSAPCGVVPGRHRPAHHGGARTSRIGRL